MPFEHGNHIGRQFQPGQSGNPGGRPKVLVELETVLNEHPTIEAVHAIFAKLRRLAMAGDVRAAKVYLDRVMGPVRPVGYVITQDDLVNAPDEVIRWLAENL